LEEDDGIGVIMIGDGKNIFILGLNDIPCLQ
jgi:hypothetical protein